MREWVEVTVAQGYLLGRLGGMGCCLSQGRGEKGWWSGMGMTLSSLSDLRRSQDSWFDRSAVHIFHLRIRSHG